MLANLKSLLAIMRPDCVGHGVDGFASAKGQRELWGCFEFWRVIKRRVEGGKWVSPAVVRVNTSRRLELKSHCSRLTLSFTKRHDEARRVCTFLNCLSYDAFGSNEKFVSRSPLRRMKSEGRALGAFPFVNSFLFNLIFTFCTPLIIRVSSSQWKRSRFSSATM